MRQNHGIPFTAETVDPRAKIQFGLKVGFRHGSGGSQYDGVCHFLKEGSLRQSSGE
jgi:hypothetical protein